MKTIRIVPLPCVLLLILAVALEAHAVPRLTIVSSPSPEVTISGFDGSAYPAFKGIFQSPDSVGTQASSIVLTNLSARTIVGITLTWVFTDVAGHQRRHSLRSDSFFSPDLRPVLLPHSKMLVTPQMMVPESMVGRGFIGGKATNWNSAANGSSAVTAAIDVIIFNDGEVVGSDKEQFATEIQARKIAAESVVEKIRVAVSRGEAVSDVLSQLSAGRPMREDLASRWTVRFAKGLLRSRNLESRLTALKELPMPPKFYRKQQ